MVIVNAVPSSIGSALQAVTPDYMQFSSAQTTPTGTCPSTFCNPGSTVTWTLGTMAPGEIQVVRYSATISTGANDGALLTADAVVTADGVSAVQDTPASAVSRAPSLAPVEMVAE